MTLTKASCDEGLFTSHGKESRLVEQVFQIRTGETGGGLGNGIEVYFGIKVLVLSMQTQDCFSALDIRHTHVDLTVEASRAQQRGVKDVGTVGRRDDNNTFVETEAVHFHQHLIQSLLALIVTAAQTRAALTADGVDFIDEDDGRRMLLGLLKQVTHTGGTDTDVEFDEVGTGDREERNSRLAGDCLGKQSLTGTGRADEQHTLGDACAHLGKAFGVLEELDDFGKLFFFFLRTFHIGKGFAVLAVGHAGSRLAEVHGAACVTAAAPAHGEEPEQTHHTHNEQIGDEADPPRDCLRCAHVVPFQDTGLTLCRDEISQIHEEQIPAGQDIACLRAVNQIHVQRRVVNDKLRDFFLFKECEDIGVRHFSRGCLRIQGRQHTQQYDNDNDIESYAAKTGLFQINTSQVRPCRGIAGRKSVRWGIIRRSRKPRA